MLSPCILNKRSSSLTNVKWLTNAAAQITASGSFMFFFFLNSIALSFISLVMFIIHDPGSNFFIEASSSSVKFLNESNSISVIIETKKTPYLFLKLKLAFSSFNKFMIAFVSSRYLPLIS